MDEASLKKLVRGGETSRTLFKENLSNPLSAAQELVACANTDGGQLLIGINDKTGEISGLSFHDIQRISSLLANAASEGVKPPITIKTETLEVEGKTVLIATVPNGMHKPYKDKDGLIFVKNGPDKRKVTSNEELAQLLQASGELYAEEMLLPFSIEEELDFREFRAFVEEKYKAEFEESELPRLIAGNTGDSAEGTARQRPYSPRLFHPRQYQNLRIRRQGRDTKPGQAPQQPERGADPRGHPPLAQHGVGLAGPRRAAVSRHWQRDTALAAGMAAYRFCE